MKSAVIYYSHYGNTAYVADKFEEALKAYGEVKSIVIEYEEENQNLIKRTLYRFFPKFVKLAPVITDLSSFDRILFGVPVWGGRPSAPLVKYLSLVSGIQGKQINCFYIYAIEASSYACSCYVCGLLYKKGATKVIDTFIPWSQAHNPSLLDKAIQESIAKLFSETT
jgi:hypothetical protein